MTDKYWVKATNGNFADAPAWALVSGGVPGTATTPGTGDNAFFDANSPTNCAIAAVAVVANLDCTGFTHTLSGASALTVEGSLTWGAGMTRTYNGLITFNSTTGVEKLITSNGITTASGMTFDGVGGVWRFADAFIMAIGGSKVMTLTNGSLSFAGINATIDRFSSSNANTRTINLTGCTLTVKGAAVPWTTATDTNLTLTIDTSSKIKFANDTATGSTISMGANKAYNDVELAGTGAGAVAFAQMGSTMRDMVVSNSGALSYTPIALVCSRDYIFSGFTGTWAGSGTTSVTRHHTLSAGMTASATGLVSMAGTGTLTNNGVSRAHQVSINAAGLVSTLGDAYVSTAATGIALVAGTFDTAGFALTMPSMNLSGSTTRTFLGNNSIVTLNGTGTAWAISVIINLTFTLGATFEIVMNNASASSKTFAGNGLTYPILRLTGGGSGVFIVNGSNTFGTLIIDAALTAQFSSSNVTTFTDVGEGLQANNAIIQSTAAGVQYTFSKKYNNAVSHGLSVQDCIASGGARWFAGRDGVNVGNNNGWRFADLYYPSAA